MKFHLSYFMEIVFYRCVKTRNNRITVFQNVIMLEAVGSSEISAHIYTTSQTSKSVTFIATGVETP